MVDLKKIFFCTSWFFIFSHQNLLTGFHQRYSTHGGVLFVSCFEIGGE